MKSFLKSFLEPLFSPADTIVYAISIVLLFHYGFKDLLIVFLITFCCILMFIIIACIKVLLYYSEVENNRVKKPISEIEE